MGVDNSMPIFIGLTIYLILAVILLTAIGIYFGQQLSYDTTSATIGTSSITGVLSSTNIFPYVWVGILLVVIPFTIWLIMVIMIIASLITGG